MAIHRQKRGNKTYLYEYRNVREGKKVRSIFVRYLGTEDGSKPARKPKRVLDKLCMSSSRRAGDVRLLWKIAEDLDFAGIIDRICCQNSCTGGPSPGKFLTIWAINRALDPESCTRLEGWVPTTDLPLLAGIEEKAFTKDAFLSSLDFICRYDEKSGRISDFTAAIDDALYKHRRTGHPLPKGKRETLAYDLTSVLFFGVTCPLAGPGFNAKKIDQLQANLALLVSKHDKYPISHFVYDGSRHASSTVNNLIARLSDAPVEPGTIIWDRGNVSKDHIKSVALSGWNLICGVPKTSKEAQAIINSTDVPFSPSTLVHKSRSGHIYAVKASGHLFGMEGSVIVYANHERLSCKINDRNLALSEIGQKLDKLGVDGKGWTESKLHKEIKSIAGKWIRLFDISVKRKGGGPRIEWRYKSRQVADNERSYGKYLLFSTDQSLTIGETVKAYFEKDFIEKAFMTLKTGESMEPVRHRLEPRVRGYIFVCVLAYRLLSVLHGMIDKAKENEDAWEKGYDLLRKLSRVERTEARFGSEVRPWYLNVTDDIKNSLKLIGMKDLLEELTGSEP